MDHAYLSCCVGPPPTSSSQRSLPAHFRGPPPRYQHLLPPTATTAEDTGGEKGRCQGNGNCRQPTTAEKSSHRYQCKSHDCHVMPYLV